MQQNVSGPEDIKLSAELQSTGNLFLKQLEKLNPNGEGPVKKGEEATAIPYYGSVVGDLLYNPSTVSISTFQRMLYTDSIIGVGFEYISANIVSRIKDFYHRNKDIERAVRKMFKSKLKGGLSKVGAHINTRHWAGFFMGQKIWRFDREDQILYCVKIRPMPPSTIQVRVDHAGEILQGPGQLGVLQYQFNYVPGLTNGLSGMSYGAPNSVNMMNSSGSMGPYLDPNYNMSYNDTLASTGDADFPIRSYFIPPYVPVGMKYETMLHATYDIGDAFDSPYGRSMFRRIHSLYVLKYAVIQLGLIALDRRGQPLIVNYCDTQKTIIDPATNIQYSAVDIANAIAPNIHGTSMVNWPGRKGEIFETVAISSDADLSIFPEMINLINDQIKDALFIPPGVLGGGGSYASDSKQGDMFDRFIKNRTEEVMQVILEQIVKPFLAYNFDEEEYYTDEGEDLGEFKYAALSLEEMLQNAKLAEILKNINAISDQNLEDLNKIRESADYEKVKKCFEPLVTSTDGTNVRDTKPVYSNSTIGDVR